MIQLAPFKAQICLLVHNGTLKIIISSAFALLAIACFISSKGFNVATQINTFINELLYMSIDIWK